MLICNLELECAYTPCLIWFYDYNHFIFLIHAPSHIFIIKILLSNYMYTLTCLILDRGTINERGSWKPTLWDILIMITIKKIAYINMNVTCLISTEEGRERRDNNSNMFNWWLWSWGEDDFYIWWLILRVWEIIGWRNRKGMIALD